MNPTPCSRPGCTPWCSSARSTSRPCVRSRTPGSRGRTRSRRLYVEFDKGESAALRERWSELDIPVPLKVISSPYRELVRPVVRYVKEIRKSSPRDVVTVYIPEYVVGRWWEQLLHNQTALRLKGRLLFMPGVMVTSVPYQLRSAGAARRCGPGVVRRRVTSAEGVRGAPVTGGPDVRRSAGRRRRPRRPRGPLRGAARRSGGVRPAHAARRAGAHPHHRTQQAVPARRRGRGARGRARPGARAVPLHR